MIARGRHGGRGSQAAGAVGTRGNPGAARQGPDPTASPRAPPSLPCAPPAPPAHLPRGGGSGGPVRWPRARKPQRRAGGSATRPSTNSRPPVAHTHLNPAAIFAPARMRRSDTRASRASAPSVGSASTLSTRARPLLPRPEAPRAEGRGCFPAALVGPALARRPGSSARPPRF